MSNDANAALLERDHQHLIHPLHTRAGHSNGRVWVKGEGAVLESLWARAYLVQQDFTDRRLRDLPCEQGRPCVPPEPSYTTPQFLLCQGLRIWNLEVLCMPLQFDLKHNKGVQFFVQFHFVLHNWQVFFALFASFFLHNCPLFAHLFS